MTLSRLLVGLVFVFSAFVKGVDPLGTAYKIEDYFVAFGTDWANGMALSLAVFLCAFEFTIGISMLFKIRMKITSGLLLATMIFFTLLTFNDALFEPVPDCGCFGDALKLTNWQTFYKNIVLIVFVGYLFIRRKEYDNRISVPAQSVVAVSVFIIFSMFSIYNLRHLPMIDFTKWKVGTQVLSDKAIESQTFVSYRNAKTKEVKEFLSPDYPWSDSIWMSEWRFVGQRVVTDEEQVGLDLFIEDESGNDFTKDVLLAEKMMVITIPDISEVSHDDLLKIVRLQHDLQQIDIRLTILSGSIPDEMDALRDILNNDSEIYFSDATVLKTMVRSNPGIIVFANGRLIKKWHYRDIPEREEVVNILRVNKIN